MKTRLKYIKITALLLAFCLTPLYAQPKCRVIKAKFQRLQVNSGEIRNQCNWSFCWLHASINKIELDIKKQTGKKIRLSTSFLAGVSLLRKANLRIQRLRNNPDFKPTKEWFEISEEWHMEDTLTLIGIFGLVPEQVVRRDAFNQEGITISKSRKRLLTNQVQVMVERYATELAELRTKGATSQEIGKLTTTTRTSIRKFIERSIDFKFSASFEYEGQTYTPLNFSKEFYPSEMRPKIFSRVQSTLYQRGENPNIYKLPGTQTSYNRNFVELPKLWQTIVEELTKGKVVMGTFINWGMTPRSPGGIVQIPLQNIPKVIQRNQTPQGRHAMLIVGFEVNQQNQVIKWKVKNSYGLDRGDGGFFYIEHNTMRAVLESVSIYK